MHLQMHTGDRPYKCLEPLCGASFIQASRLSDHVKSMHSAEGQMRHKKQEQRVECALLSAGLNFKREHHIDFSCIGTMSFARIDFILLLHGHIVCLEVDESQHKFGYGNVSCDLRRMASVVESLTLEGNALPIVFLRYNPDAFCQDGMPARMKKCAREKALVAILEEGSPIYTHRPLVVHYMYYDNTCGSPDVLCEPDYNETMVSCCVY